MIIAAILATMLVCEPATQTTPAPTAVAPAKAPLIDWSAPNSEHPPPVISTPGGAGGDLGFGQSSPRPQTGGDFLRGQAQAPAGPAAEPSVADLFRERNAREAAAKAAAESAAAPEDGTFHCRRTETGLTCGNNEEAMKQTEAANKALMDQLLAAPK